ncbi:DUF1428 domain-containing protein [Marinicella sediminis]|uniref:DUF1428 domain-containing protein n=1 Tax=Marinicella sediminis TaxID=1792834 RepID=A0ABV7JE18_9GAMM|nr:DUF1428 domain-containing protein [Marinicella sediminis]
MSFVDGFVAAVPTVNKAQYQQHIELAGQAFKKHGALQFAEGWGVDVPPGKITSMPDAVKSQADETVVFSWLVWPSKKVRDEAMPKVMADPWCSNEQNPMPFDASRLIHGGFDVLVNL